MTDEQCNDKTLVMAAVLQSGNALKYASKALKADREVVLTAVTGEGKALQYADEALKNDQEVVIAAVLTSALYRKQNVCILEINDL